MNIAPDTLRLYAVSDRSWLKENETLKDILPLLFENGVTLFQLREKHLTREAFLQEAQELQKSVRITGYRSSSMMRSILQRKSARQAYMSACPTWALKKRAKS